MRLPNEWIKDKLAYDLATFALLPYEVDQEKLQAWRKIGHFDAGGNFFSGSLLYSEHGMDVDRETHRAAHVMPSVVLDYFYNWMIRPHRISSYDRDKCQWGNEGILNLPIASVRGPTMCVNNILEKRFETKLLLNRP